MSVLDIFNEDAFSLVNLTDAINLLPYQPSRLGRLGIFTSKGVTTTSVAIERKGKVLSLLPSTSRGTVGTKRTAEKRDVRSLLVPHIPHHDTILADDIQNVRSFGKDDVAQAISEIVSDRQQGMRANHEVTEEWLRVGAIKGQIIDGDGSTVLYNLFTEFGVTQTEVDFVLGTAGTEIKVKCMDVRRAIEDELGGTTFSKIRAFCGDGFWDKFIVHDAVKEAYDRWQDGKFFREDQRVPGGDGGFEFCNIYWENYRGKVGSTPFIPDGDCRFIVDGVQDLFKTYYAPADYIETVNTVGRQVYNKQRRLDFDKGIELESQSNPLPICTRPNTLIRGFSSN